MHNGQGPSDRDSRVVGSSKTLGLESHLFWVCCCCRHTNPTDAKPKNECTNPRVSARSGPCCRHERCPGCKNVFTPPSSPTMTRVERSGASARDEFWQGWKRFRLFELACACMIVGKSKVWTMKFSKLMSSCGGWVCDSSELLQASKLSIC